jgi:hypothetical protein
MDISYIGRAIEPVPRTVTELVAKQRGHLNSQSSEIARFSPEAAAGQNNEPCNQFLDRAFNQPESGAAHRFGFHQGKGAIRCVLNGPPNGV